MGWGYQDPIFEFFCLIFVHIKKRRVGFFEKGSSSKEDCFEILHSDQIYGKKMCNKYLRSCFDIIFHFTNKIKREKKVYISAVWIKGRVAKKMGGRAVNWGWGGSASN